MGKDDLTNSQRRPASSTFEPDYTGGEFTEKRLALIRLSKSSRLHPAKLLELYRRARHDASAPTATSYLSIRSGRNHQRGKKNPTCAGTIMFEGADQKGCTRHRAVTRPHGDRAGNVRGAAPEIGQLLRRQTLRLVDCFFKPADELQARKVVL